MTFFFGDGFDCYRDVADCATYWDAALGSSVTLAISASGRFSGSRGLVAYGFSSAPHITKTSGANDAIHHISVAYEQTVAFSGTLGGIFFTLYDGATAQCTVAFRSDGAITLMAGANGGTNLAIYTGAVPGINLWYQFEIEVVISNTAGSISVRRNGNTVNDFSLGSLNTRASANNYANKIGTGFAYNSGGAALIDDFLWRSDASSVAWIGDVRCYTRMPAADSAVQFTRSGSVVPVTPFGAATISSSTANQARYSPFLATCSGTVATALISLNAGYTGNMKCSLFNDSAGSPGTVLASATTITNPVTGNNTFTFASPPSVTQGTKYWFGVNSDTTAASSWNQSASGTFAYSVSAVSFGATYAAFPVANPTGLSTGQQSVIFTVNITPTTATNANLVAEAVQDAAGGYVLSSTNGQADLYTLQAASSTPFLPATVIGVTTRGLFSKSDAGTRNATVQLKSGGVTVAGASTALPVGSWQWVARNDLTDPATSAAWTPSGVNAALIGPSVTA